MSVRSVPATNAAQDSDLAALVPEHLDREAALTPEMLAAIQADITYYNSQSRSNDRQPSSNSNGAGNNSSATQQVVVPPRNSGQSAPLPNSNTARRPSSSSAANNASSSNRRSNDHAPTSYRMTAYKICAWALTSAVTAYLIGMSPAGGAIFGDVAAITYLAIRSKYFKRFTNKLPSSLQILSIPVAAVAHVVLPVVITKATGFSVPILTGAVPLLISLHLVNHYILDRIADRASAWISGRRILRI